MIVSQELRDVSQGIMDVSQGLMGVSQGIMGVSQAIMVGFWGCFGGFAFFRTFWQLIVGRLVLGGGFGGECL